MGDLLQSLLQKPELLRQAAEGSGMSAGEIESLIRNLRGVIAKLGRVEDYAHLQALLDRLETLSEGTADAASGPSSLS